MIRRTRTVILATAAAAAALTVTSIALATTTTTTTPVTFCIGAKGVTTYPGPSGACPAKTTPLRVGSASDVQSLAQRLDSVESKLDPTAQQCPADQYVSGVDATGGLVCTGLPSPPPSAPGAVTGLAASAVSGTEVQLTWTYPGGETLAQVVIRRAQGSVAPATPSDGVGIAGPTPAAPGTVEQVNDAGLAQGTTYSYAVFSRDSGGGTSPPATVTVATLPGPVDGLVARAVSATEVQLTWTYPSGESLAQVVIRRAAGAVAPATPSDGAAVFGPTPGAAGSVDGVNDGGLTPATTYSYAVFSVDGSGQVSPPATATVTTS